ncbi:MAG TPA: hypothetical protein VHH88_07530, partial [Verrucomicrobiae bacterium]|nr:hypothetical protein [Verrucomicrobiae bacterium]
VSVETKDGLEYTGVLVKESPDQLILRDASGKENTVAKNNIDNRVTGGSLMPSGLVDGLTAGERLDLFRFLAELGKPGPYDASKGTVARSWRLLVQTLDLAQFGDDKALHTGLDDKQWETADSLVDGDLLKENLVNAMKRVASRDPTAVYAATRFEAAKSGPVDLKFLGARPAMIWLDGEAISAAGLSHADVSAGTHVFIAKISAKNFPDALKLESSDVTFLND